MGNGSRHDPGGAPFFGSGRHWFYGRHQGKHVVTASARGMKGVRHEFTVGREDVHIPLELTKSPDTHRK